MPPRPTSVILFWMWGGPSQFETFDPKPDAPSEYRGPFRPIHTTVPGMDVCELFPRLASQGRRLALIRSCTTRWLRTMPQVLDKSRTWLPRRAITFRYLICIT
jgi:hypothetical protein